jgi:hypothetical protein
MTLRTLIIIVITFSTSGIYAQKLSSVPKIHITPIHTFLQQNADSTLIFSYASGFVDAPTYFILSKKNDTLTLYKYDSGSKNYLARLPKKIRDSLYKLNRPWESHKIGINRFFSVINIQQDSAKAFWSKVESLRAFQLKDDSENGEGCPKSNVGYNNNIYDGGGIELYLVTKNKIKNLYYYAPQYYEKLCPGREDRKAVIKLEELFLTYFREPK